MNDPGPAQGSPYQTARLLQGLIARYTKNAKCCRSSNEPSYFKKNLFLEPIAEALVVLVVKHKRRRPSQLALFIVGVAFVVACSP